MSTPPRRRTRRREPTPEERRRILAEEAREARLPKLRPLGAVAATITGVLALVGVAVFLSARHAKPLESFPYPLGVACGLGATVIYSIVVFRLLERLGELRTVSTIAMRVVIVLLAVIGASAASVGVLTLLNVRLDRSPAVMHRALVLARPPGAVREGAAAGVRVEWEPEVEKVVGVPTALLAQLEPRRSVLVVRLRPGRFGWPWIEGNPEVMTPPPPPPPVGAAAVPEASRAEARALMAEAAGLLRDGSHEQAVPAIKRAIELDPWNMAAYLALDSALSQQKDYETAADYWSRLLALDLSNLDARFGRARARRAANDQSGALDDATEACNAGHGKACELAWAIRTLPPPAPAR